MSDHALRIVAIAYRHLSGLNLDDLGRQSVIEDSIEQRGSAMTLVRLTGAPLDDCFRALDFARDQLKENA